ncbi:MAG: AraC family transcriptional regulator [Kordia sp.]|nr:MAG: AraC family transcriptional regulator [Kordia sp.]
MNYRFTSFYTNGLFVLTDFNCASLEERLDTRMYYKIIWAKETDISLEIDGYTQTLKQNQIIFCTPVNNITIKPFTRGVVSFIFNREFYCIRDHDAEVSCNGLLFFGSSNSPIITLDEKEQESFNLLYLILKEEFETKDQIQGEMLLVLLKRLLIKATRLIKGNLIQPLIKNEQLDLIRQFNLLVEMHFKTKHRVTDYAVLLERSPKTLSNVFSKYNAKTPLKVISERICLEAQRLLLFSKKSVTDIGFELGFTDVSHFSKFFKKHYQQTPAAYRISSQGKN